MGKTRATLLPLLGIAVIVLGVLVAMIPVQNAALGAFFPHLSRFTTDFSPAYLQREIDYIGSFPPRTQTVFFGDSVLWGYQLAPNETAVSGLTNDGCACHNFAFKAGGPVNYYALTRLLTASGVKPRLVVVEVNQMLFNSDDEWYQALHPAVSALSRPLLTPNELAALSTPAPVPQLERSLDRWVAPVWQLYAMRSDIRETLYGEATAATPKPANAEALAGSYDLTPLDDTNVGVHFLEKTVELLRASHIPVLAFMTPTNHTLMHKYIDDPEYAANVSYVARALEARGANVRDFDAKFSPSDFIDNDHLTAAGQRRLLSLLLPELSH